MSGNSRLRDERIQQGMTQRDLAHFSGLTHATISRLETGSLRDVAAESKVRIARALRLNVKELWPQ